MPNPTIHMLTLPSGSVYEIADLAARAAAQAGIQLIECTQASNTPKDIEWDNDGTTVTGTLVPSENTSGKIYLVPISGDEENNIFAEYVTVLKGNAYSWEKIGTTEVDLSVLGALAYKDTASGTYTPEGAIAVNSSDGTGTSYTPEGSITAPAISLKTAGATESVTPFGSAGTLPSLSMTVSEGNLTISFNQGTLPTAGNAVTVKTGDAAYEAAAPTFTGTEKKLAFGGTQATVTVS